MLPAVDLSRTGRAGRTRRTGRTRRAGRLAGAFLAVAAALAATLTVAPDAGARTPLPPQGLVHGAPQVHTQQGVLSGRRAAPGVDFFGRVPFASPPVGALRWRPPQPAPSSRGVRDASGPSPVCPQTENSNGPRSETEDCLYLDVWRPDTPAVRAGRAPVLYWVFGGGGINGSGSQYQAAELAAETGAVVVTVNHRLGRLGFLALPSLSGEASDGMSGQYGLMDQIAGLRWLRSNASALGGDPQQVTVAGQSAGGRAVCRMLAAPPAQGLFARAIIESGACDAQPLGPAQEAGTAFAASVGCGDPATAAQCLRGKDVGTLLDRPGPSGTPTIGGTVLPLDPRQAIAAGRFTHVPVLVGNTHDENRPYPGIAQPATVDSLAAWVRSSYPHLAEQILDLYADRTPADAAGAIASDPDRVCRAWTIENALAPRTRTYAYEFADATAPAEAVTPGFTWGAYHTTELEYLFTFTRSDGSQKFLTGLNAAQEHLARSMRAQWGAFVATGRPDPRQGPWPTYRADRPATLQFRLPHAALTAGFTADHHCDFWNAHGLIRTQ
ncbi:carboxylesterase family protein [Streptomyces sp. NPDC006733]|uniref:carboxylesterase/lipase family protein n=1 Tax=Streptomyces sp. NPDC006733 TaxID=3155460 RepID=UPI0033CCED23